MAYPAPLKRRSSGSASSGEFKPSPVKSSRYDNSSQQTIHTQPLYVGLLTKTPMKNGIGRDARGMRSSCVVCDENKQFHLMHVFGKQVMEKFAEVNKVYRILNYKQQKDDLYSINIMLADGETVESQSQITLNETSIVEMVAEKNVSITQPIFITKFLSDRKLSKTYVSFIAKVTAKLEKEELVSKEGRPFAKQRYRVGDSSGNVQFSVLGIDIEESGLVVLGNTYKFNMMETFVNGKVIGGLDVSFKWYSSVELIDEGQKLEEVAEMEEFQKVIGVVDSFTNLEIRIYCPNCQSDDLVMYDKTIKCNNCCQACRKSSGLEKIFCELVILPENSKVAKRCLVNEKKVRLLLLGDDLDYLTTNSDPYTEALNKNIDKKYLFTLNVDQKEIIDAEIVDDE